MTTEIFAEVEVIREVQAAGSVVTRRHGLRALVCVGSIEAIVKEPESPECRIYLTGGHDFLCTAESSKRLAETVANAQP